MAKLLAKKGTYLQFSIDPLTHLRLTYSLKCTEHLTGLRVTTSGIVRAALHDYVNRLESLVLLSNDDPNLYLLKRSLESASEGDKAQWAESLLIEPREDVFPTFTALVDANVPRPIDRAKGILKKPLRPRRT